VIQLWANKASLHLLRIQQRSNMMLCLVLTLLDVILPVGTLIMNTIIEGQWQSQQRGAPFASEFLMADYTGDEFSSDYRELTLPLTTTMLVAVVDPILTPLLLALLMAMNLFLDLYKLTHDFRRPAIIEDYGIGWSRLALLRPMTLLAPITNWFLFGLHMWYTWPSMHHHSSLFALCTFSIVAVLLLSVVWLIMMIPFESPGTLLLRRRHNWQRQKLQDLLHDEYGNHRHPSVCRKSLIPH